MAEGRLVCRCREISEAEVLDAIRDGARSLRGVKVRTRAMTGLCQGQTCGPIIEAILRRELGTDFRQDDRRARAPVRVLPVSVLAGGLTPGSSPCRRGVNDPSPHAVLPSPARRGAGGEA